MPLPPNIRKANCCSMCAENPYLIDSAKCYCKLYDFNVYSDEICDSFKDSAYIGLGDTRYSSSNNNSSTSNSLHTSSTNHTIERRPRMSEAFTDVKYQCKQCGAEDTLKHAVGTPVPLAINCWNPKCRAGYGTQVSQMLQANIGMHRVVEG